MPVQVTPMEINWILFTKYGFEVLIELAGLLKCFMEHIFRYEGNELFKYRKETWCHV